MSITIEVQSDFGARLEDVASSMSLLAINLKIGVRCQFNNVPLKANPGDSKQVIVRMYRDMVEVKDK